MSSKPYDRDFYRTLDTTAETSAREIVPMLLDLLPVLSVVDVGCGDGGWLATFRTFGVTDLAGIDGPWIDADLLKIDARQFHRARLDASVPMERRFDLAMSLEVAKHLPPERAESFVGELTRLAPVVLFSAAPPGQTGVHHVNEQWPDYWTKLFAARGFRPIDVLRRQVWDNPNVTYWYKQNLLLFADADSIARNAKLAAAAAATPGMPHALIHPDLFRSISRASQPRIGRWLKMAPAVLRRSLRAKAPQR